MFNRIIKSPKGRIGTAILAFLMVVVLLAPLISPNDPSKRYAGRRLEGPSSDFILGTDYLGRCVASRIIYGSCLSLEIAFLIVGIQMAIGLVLGGVAGYFGGLVDDISMRLAEIFMALPSIVLALVFVGIIGPGPITIISALCITGWPEYARIVRCDILILKEKEFIKSARAFGFSNGYILRRHIIPNIIEPVINLGILSTGFVIVLVSAFSFIGMGFQPPQIDWGLMLNEGQAYMHQAPHLILFPGVAVMMSTLAFNLVGDAMRNASDPRFEVHLKSGSFYAVNSNSKS